MVQLPAHRRASRDTCRSCGQPIVAAEIANANHPAREGWDFADDGPFALAHDRAVPVRQAPQDAPRLRLHHPRCAARRGAA